MPVSSFVLPPRSRAVLGGLGAVVLLAFSLGSAQASVTTYCAWTASGYETCAGPAVSLNDNLVQAQYSTWSVCAGAETTSGTFYGHYLCATDYACHDYAGGTLIPLAHNHESFSQYITATYYSGSSYSSSCPRGSTTTATTTSTTTSTASTLTDTSSRLRSPAGSGTVLHRADGSACLRISDTVPGSGLACAPAAVVAAGGLLATLEPGPGSSESTAVLAAVAPSGVSAALVTTPAGSTQRYPVLGGALLARIPSGTLTLTWAGSSTVAIPVP